MTPFSVSDIISFLSMVVALAAVITGPIVSVHVAKRQIISPIRQKWIDELRELISTLLSKCHAAVILTGAKGLLEERHVDKQLLSEILFFEQKLILMLNPLESDHNKLLELVSAVVDVAQHGAPDLLAFGQQLRAASSSGKVILKREWERVRLGEA